MHIDILILIFTTLQISTKIDTEDVVKELKCTDWSSDITINLLTYNGHNFFPLKYLFKQCIRVGILSTYDTENMKYIV
jgi:hypothetical protein